MAEDDIVREIHEAAADARRARELVDLAVKAVTSARRRCAVARARFKASGPGPLAAELEHARRELVAAEVGLEREACAALAAGSETGKQAAEAILGRGNR